MYLKPDFLVELQADMTVGHIIHQIVGVASGNNGSCV